MMVRKGQVKKDEGCPFLEKGLKCVLFYKNCKYLKRVDLIARCDYKRKFIVLYQDEGSLFWCRGILKSKFKYYLNRILLLFYLTNVSLKNFLAGNSLDIDLQDKSTQPDMTIESFIDYCIKVYNGWIQEVFLNDSGSLVYKIWLPLTNKRVKEVIVEQMPVGFFVSIKEVKI